MPFDATPTELKPIDKLIQALRGPEPEDWDFGTPCNCAMAVACQIGVASGVGIVAVAESIKMTAATARKIFWPEAPYITTVRELNELWDAVRPRHVAAALEHYRDTGEALSPFEFVKRERES